MCQRKVPARYFIVLGCCSCLTMSYIMRCSLSLRTTDVRKHQESICPRKAGEKHTMDRAVFKMTPRQRGLMHGAFYWGYFVTCMIGGVLSDIFNKKFFMLGGIFGTCIVTCFTPVLSRTFEWLGLIVCRLTMGLTEGIFYASLIAIAAAWIPPKERSSLGSILFAASPFGVAISHLLEILMRDIKLDWENEFYIYSGIGFLVVIVIYSTLKFYPKHLTEDGGKFYDDYHAPMEKEKHYRNVPLKAILHNIHVWAVVCASFGHDWNFFMITSFEPTYLHSVLPSDYFRSELIMFIALLCMWSGAIISGFICDNVQKRKLISLTWNRKITYFTGSTISAACSIAIVYLKCNEVWLITFAVISSIAKGFFYSSVKINPLDLNPTYAATISSVAQMGVCSAGVLVPYAYSSVIKTGSMEEWRILQLMTSVIVFLGGVTYFTFATAEEQTLGVIHHDLQHGRAMAIA
ncbi:hypothetical protein O3M35_011311 [Rhynocoris fuscipes]|uniref:Major facilitator superfamily (MFS) profile domain-containing protein n=1 Tax=Rhynocoris fuscipes TaxID=488301 RepID=A0AAW1CXM3_9HEMI